MNRRHSHPGFFLADISIGLSVVAALAVVMFLLLAREQALARRMAHSRAATRAAEAALSDLQARRPLQSPTTAPGNLDGSSPSVSFLPVDGGGAVPGHAWVRVRATVADRSVELLGVVPESPDLWRLEAQDPAAAAGEAVAPPATAPTRPTTGEAP